MDKNIADRDALTDALLYLDATIYCLEGEQNIKRLKQDLAAADQELCLAVSKYVEADERLKHATLHRN